MRSIREELGSSAPAVITEQLSISLSEFFRSLLLSFSPTLDEHNPDIPEWREDVARVVRAALSQVHHVSVLPGSFLELKSASSGFHGHYYFIPMHSVDMAVTTIYVFE